MEDDLKDKPLPLGMVEHACNHQPLEGRGRRITARLKLHWWSAWQGDCGPFPAPPPFSSRSGKKPRETVWCVAFSSQNKGNRKLSAILVNHGLRAVLAWTAKEFHMVRSVLAAAPGCEQGGFFLLPSQPQPSGSQESLGQSTVGTGTQETRLWAF